MIKLSNGRYIIGFDDGYQLGKTANFIFDNGVHMLGSVEPTLKEHSLFYDGEYFKVGEGRSAITEDKISDDTARLRTMAGIAMELKNAGINKAEVVRPSSLLEVIVLKSDKKADYERLADMLKEVNATQLSEEERLSDHVYVYSKSEEMLQIAA